MNKRLVAGFDIGTSKIRCILYDLRGNIKFIGDSEERIKEDYLRMIRFFRFYGTYGKKKISACMFRNHAKCQ